MKEHGFHFGSFLLGLLIGVVVLALLAVSLPPKNEATANTVLQKDISRFQASVNQSVKKVTVQVQDNLSSFSRQYIQPASHWFIQQWKNLVSFAHAQAAPTCSGLAWFNQARAHFLVLLGIHSQPVRFQGCAPV
jgi:gas vesicle protein